MHRPLSEVLQTTGLRPLTTSEELETAVARSFVQPVLVFKHSSRCGTSSQAYHELLGVLESSKVEADVYLVHVQSSRPVSDAIAARFGLRHESPQILLIRNGAVHWHASHFRVTVESIAKALERCEATS